MDHSDRVPWPPAYRRIVRTVGAIGVVVALLAALLSWSWLSLGFLAAGGVLALMIHLLSRHMRDRPMLAVESGELVYRRESGSQRRSANLMTEHRAPLPAIAEVHREIQPWPGQGGARHYYRLGFVDGRVDGLVPRPADAPTQAAMAAFFDRHFPGRVRETRLG